MGCRGGVCVYLVPGDTWPCTLAEGCLEPTCWARGQGTALLPTAVLREVLGMPPLACLDHMVSPGSTQPLLGFLPSLDV